MKAAFFFALAVVGVCLQCCRAAVAKRNAKPSPEDDRIIYPGMSSMPHKGGSMPTMGMSHKGDHKVPAECHGKTYCTVKSPDYPEKEFNQMFSNVNKPVFAYQPTLIPVTLDNRQGDPGERTDCSSTITFEPLYQVKTKDSDDWRWVVQAPDAAIIQKVRLETCRQEGASCFNVVPADSSFTTMCRQLYSTWEVLVKKGDTNQTEKVNADLPVCCQCRYKMT